MPLFIILILLMMNNALYAERAVFVKPEQTLFVKVSVPPVGVTCSNVERTFRLSKLLKNVKHYTTSWGTNVFIGVYNGKEMFLVNAPVGSGSGLVFTELFAHGAKYIVRYGSDDLKNPHEQDKFTVKIIDETDNLYGFSHASGVPEEEWGKSIFASPVLLKIFEEEAKKRNFKTTKGVCHHLENYHALRNPTAFSPQRTQKLKKWLETLKRTDKPESFDMESAVLFRVAKDYDGHAISILQTFNKEKLSSEQAEAEAKKQMLEMEKVFADYIFTTLSKIEAPEHLEKQFFG